MNVETITSRQNPLMAHLRKLASSRSYRKKSGEYLCDGTKLLDEALKWGAPVQTAVFSDGVEIPTLPDTVRAVCVSEDLMRSVSPMETPQGALFTVALPETKLPETLAGKHYLVLDGGSEGRGLSQQMLDECAKTLKIPMSPRCESLNAAIAATVVLWEMYR